MTRPCFPVDFWSKSISLTLAYLQRFFPFCRINNFLRFEKYSCFWVFVKYIQCWFKTCLHSLVNHKSSEVKAFQERQECPQQIQTKQLQIQKIYYILATCTLQFTPGESKIIINCLKPTGTSNGHFEVIIVRIHLGCHNDSQSQIDISAMEFFFAKNARGNIYTTRNLKVTHVTNQER